MTGIAGGSLPVGRSFRETVFLDPFCPQVDIREYRSSPMRILLIADSGLSGPSTAGLLRRRRCAGSRHGWRRLRTGWQTPVPVGAGEGHSSRT